MSADGEEYFENLVKLVEVKIIMTVYVFSGLC